MISPDGIHLALAVDLDDALYLPVLRDCDQRTSAQLQAAIEETVALLSRQMLPPDRLAGGCMALSNLGMYPLDAFDPIIFPGHSGILALGAIQRVPIITGEQLVIRPVLRATLAVDHRAINGRLAAAFLTDIKQQIEEII
ncbi:MAG: Dihydrolipoyllysine-residue acyltransferase component of branched-chain alpha-ketoacid dehydrogenase complex [bacterium ADurb.Bin429]|nr:MAG: Dihydrolipoyllysine-residue acyltransferase component of branched-chain alpha-ketoacid dehydrogenase complex [bacterium ADurb.Bin429]